MKVAGRPFGRSTLHTHRQEAESSEAGDRGRSFKFDWILDPQAAAEKEQAESVVARKAYLTMSQGVLATKLDALKIRFPLQGDSKPLR